MIPRPFTPRALALVAALACGAAHAAVPEARQASVQRALAQLNAQPQAVAVTGDDEFIARSAAVDPDGTEHVHFDRTYRGLRVIGGDLITHVDTRGGARLLGITRQLSAPIDLDTQPRTPAARAETLARGAPGRRVDAVHAELVVYAREHAPVLAYDVRVRGTDALGHLLREHLILDAADLSRLDGWSELQPVDAVATGITHYAGTVTLHTDLNNGVSSLVDLTRGRHAVYDLANRNGMSTSASGKLMTDTDNVWGDGVQSNTSQSDGVDAMYGQNMAWDYYLSTFGRRGIADDGRGAYSRVHSLSSPYLYNAWWDDSCFCMTYTSQLDESNPPLLSLDVVGHEMTHGVTSSTAGLVYSRESGGLNEGTSDIMGSMVEFYAQSPNDPPDYLMGEDFGTPLRYMHHPSLDGMSADCWYPEVGDLDVHLSSGVANHFFYLLAQGSRPDSAYPDSPTCRSTDRREATGRGSLAGIGNAQAQAIWYRALTRYFTSTTNYAGARAATLRAAADLYGGVGSPTYLSVAAAWSAVLVN